MKHAVILAHPRARSFVRLLAETYVEAVTARGHEVELFDLYALGFDPCLKAEELPTGQSGEPGVDVVQMRARLADADVFAFFYPIWFGGPPAILKGFVDRVFTSGFGYRSVKGGGLDPLLTGRKMISVTASGSENAWLVESGGWDAVRISFDRRLANAAGMTSLEHINFGGVDDNLDPAMVAEAVAGVRRAVAELF